MKGFEQLYNEIAPGLTNYLVGSGSTYATACDIVQETFVRVWKRRDELMDDDAQIREIARQTNVSESNVKVRIHRAKMQLRERLKV